MEHALRYSMLLFACLTLLLAIGTFAFDWDPAPAVVTSLISAALSLMLENHRSRADNVGGGGVEKQP
ncbi:MAG: hypothetical protein Q4A92_11225 [Corynebacterium sp.]|nr:hypothetical protein [Corynebacterium sp.]